MPPKEYKEINGVLYTRRYPEKNWEVVSHEEMFKRQVQRETKLEAYKSILWDITEGEWDPESLRNALELKIKIIEDK